MRTDPSESEGACALMSGTWKCSWEQRHGGFTGRCSSGDVWGRVSLLLRLSSNKPWTHTWELFQHLGIFVSTVFPSFFVYLTTFRNNQIFSISHCWAKCAPLFSERSQLLLYWRSSFSLKIKNKQTGWTRSPDGGTPSLCLIGAHWPCKWTPSTGWELPIDGVGRAGAGGVT